MTAIKAKDPNWYKNRVKRLLTDPKARSELDKIAQNVRAKNREKRKQERESRDARVRP